jgi:hypothetical protein
MSRREQWPAGMGEMENIILSVFEIAKLISILSLIPVKPV